MDKKIIIIVVLITLIWYFKCKSSFVGSPLYNASNILIFYSPGCGWCTKSMPDFKDAASKSDKIILIDASQNRDLASAYGISAYPTIIKGDGGAYTGNDRTSESILAFL